MLNIKYLKFKFFINFEKDFFFSKLPTFLLRSLLGSELRKLTCITSKKSCSDCIINKTCVYSYIFETHINKDNKVLSGVNRLSHPFVMHTFSDFGTKDCSFEITLIGQKAIKYFPYIFYSFKNLGEKGIFKDRIKYKITRVQCNNKDILKGDYLKTPEEYLNFSISKDDVNKNNLIDKSFNIELKTPLRFKKNGQYVSNLKYEDFIVLSNRRLNMLNKLYGENKKIEDFYFDDFSQKEILKNAQVWNEYEYFSRRQNKNMKLGGVIGEVSFKGKFSKIELKLLEFSKIFNLGKNISFGLGKLGLEEF